MKLLLLAFILGTVASLWAEGFREVSFLASDGGRVTANLYGSGERGVVLAHGAVFNKESWDPLARTLAGDGLQVLAIDFRGYGDSKAGSEGRALYLDVLAAVRYLKQHGAGSVSVLGGSMGGRAAAMAAIESKPGELDRLILLAPPPVSEPGKIKGNKLFVVSAGDGLAAGVKKQYAAAPEPKRLVVLEGSAHAQHIFKTPHGAELERLIRDFLGGR